MLPPPPPPSTSATLSASNHHLPYAHHVAAAIAAAGGGPPVPMPYHSQEPPLLQNPERVVLYSESEQFERSFQPNVALAPRRTSQPTRQSSISGHTIGQKPRIREHMLEQKHEHRISPLSIQIKLERPTTPMEDETVHEKLHSHLTDDADNHQLCSISTPQSDIVTPSSPPAKPAPDTGSECQISNEPVPQAPGSPILLLTESATQHNHQLPQLQPLASASPPIPSPEGHSGSNEITSSTSPVPETTSSSHPVDSRDSISDDNAPLIGQLNSMHQTTNSHHHHHLQLHTNGTAAISPELNINHHHKKITINSELELSTDTDDDSIIGEPDSSNHNPIWDNTVDALKDTPKPDRDRVLDVVKQLLAENASYAAECAQLRQELRRRDDLISELKLGPASSSDEGGNSNEAKIKPNAFSAESDNGKKGKYKY